MFQWNLTNLNLPWLKQFEWGTFSVPLLKTQTRSGLVSVDHSMGHEWVLEEKKRSVPKISMFMHFPITKKVEDDDDNHQCWSWLESLLLLCPVGLTLTAQQVRDRRNRRMVVEHTMMMVVPNSASGKNKIRSHKGYCGGLGQVSQWIRQGRTSCKKTLWLGWRETKLSLFSDYAGFWISAIW